MTNSRLDLTEIAWVRAQCTSGANLADRQAARLSQREVADDCNVTVATISRWENGGGLPTGRRALAYARTLRKIRRAVAAEKSSLVTAGGGPDAA